MQRRRRASGLAESCSTPFKRIEAARGAASSASTLKMENSVVQHLMRLFRNGLLFENNLLIPAAYKYAGQDFTVSLLVCSDSSICTFLGLSL